jgi:16S rRNA (uracil1498-N3)-methyltransferase
MLVCSAAETTCHNATPGDEDKSLTRIYFSGPLPAGAEVGLPPAQAHHVARVLRMKAGERVTLFNGDGADYPALITAANKSEVRVQVEAAHPAARESPLEIVLAQGLSRAERMDYTVQKAVELGVARVEPVLARRSVVRLDAARARQKQAHWQAVAIGACEQCGRARVPAIAAPETLDDWLKRWRTRSDGTPGLLLDPASGQSLRELTRPAAAVTLLAGPEGGFSEEESAAARASGFIPVRLGPRVLRTETAAVAALAAMQALWGDF